VPGDQRIGRGDEVEPLKERGRQAVKALERARVLAGGHADALELTLQVFKAGDEQHLAGRQVVGVWHGVEGDELIERNAEV